MLFLKNYPPSDNKREYFCELFVSFRTTKATNFSMLFLRPHFGGSDEVRLLWERCEIARMYCIVLCTLEATEFTPKKYGRENYGVKYENTNLALISRVSHAP
jgi:hypothetical protein